MNDHPASAPAGSPPGQVLGIIAIIVAVFLGPLGMVLGFISRKQAKRGGGPVGLGVAALIVGALTTLALIVGVLLMLALALVHSGELQI